MSIRSRQRIVERITKIGLIVIIIAASLFISSETYKVAQNIKEIQQDFVIFHEIVDKFFVD